VDAALLLPFPFQGHFSSLRILSLLHSSSYCRLAATFTRLTRDDAKHRQSVT
jgi:hypothetical protein